MTDYFGFLRAMPFLRGFTGAGAQALAMWEDITNSNSWLKYNDPSFGARNRAEESMRRKRDLIKNSNGRVPAYGDFYADSNLQQVGSQAVAGAGVGNFTRMARDALDLYVPDVVENVSYDVMYR